MRTCVKSVRGINVWFISKVKSLCLEHKMNVERKMDKVEKE